MVDKGKSPFFVVTNSKLSFNAKKLESVSHDEMQKEEGEEARKEDNSKNECYDESEQLGYGVPSSIPIVHLVEAPKGMYMLDFCNIDNSYVATFLDENNLGVNKYIGSSATRVYIEANAWGHLIAYAKLVGKDINVESLPVWRKGMNESVSQHARIFHGMLDKCDDRKSCFVPLEDDLKDAVNTLLPLNRLFSWEVLLNARKQGNLNWKDTWSFIFKVRTNVPFHVKDGILRHMIKTHLTFHQFVAFSRLLEIHSETRARTLPHVKVQAQRTSSSTVDFQMESSHDCMVYIGIVIGRSEPPSALTLRCQQSDKFVSQRSVNLTAGFNTEIGINSLRSDTAYDMYMHLERYCAEGKSISVASTDADVLKSRIVFVTEPQTDHIPVFKLTKPEVQRIEVCV